VDEAFFQDYVEKWRFRKKFKDFSSKRILFLRSYLLIEIQMGKVRSIFLVNEAYFEDAPDE